MKYTIDTHTHTPVSYTHLDVYKRQVSDEMGSIYYKGFSEEEITQFEECLDRIRKNLEEWQKS